MNFKMPFKSTKYEPIQDQERDLPSDSKDEVLNQPYFQPAKSSQLPSMITILVLAGLAGFFFARNLQLNKGGSFVNGYGTELALATPAIQVSKVKFTGGIKFHDNGTMFRDNGPGPEYVGRPSDEIDANWDALIGTRYLFFTEKQKSTFKVDMDPTEDGLYRAGPDVLHSLHCVNKLRQTIDGYVYGLTDQIDESYQNVLHLEHCLDFLRQLVQCTSDLSPIPLVYSKGAGFPIPDFEQEHTCRSFEAIHHWAMKQNADALKTVDHLTDSIVP